MDGTISHALNDLDRAETLVAHAINLLLKHLPLCDALRAIHFHACAAISEHHSVENYSPVRDLAHRFGYAAAIG